MGRVVDLQAHKAALGRANQGSYREARKEGDVVDHMARLQAQFEASRNLDDSARIYCAVETYFGRDLPQAAAATARLHMSGFAAATALAGIYWKQLLHFGLSLVATPSLQRGDEKCRTASARTNAQRAPEQFGEGI